jgi:hypothetical protein
MKKKLIFIILLNVIYLKSYSQNCSIIKQFNTFHGIKLGQNLPDSIIKPAIELYKGNPLYHIYDVTEDDFNKNGMANPFWFSVMDYHFDDIAFSVFDKKKIFKIALGKAPNEMDSSYFYQNKIPPTYLKFVSNLQNLLGKQSYYYDTTELNYPIKDSATNKIKLVSLSRKKVWGWACDNIKIEATFIYGYDCLFEFEITNILLEKQKDIEEFTK